MTAKELREKRGALFTRIKELREKCYDKDGKFVDFDEATKANWDTLNADYDALDRQIEVAERVERMESSQGAPNPGPGRDAPYRETPANRGSATVVASEHRQRALGAWARAQFQIDLTDDEQESCRQARLNPHAKELTIRLHDDNQYQNLRGEFGAVHRRDQTVGTPAAGGYLVETFLGPFEVARLAFGGMREVSTILRTATGGDYSFMTTDDTSNTGAYIAEGAAISEQDVTIGRITLHAYKVHSKLIQVSYELLRDSVVDIPSFLGQRMGERIGRIENTAFTTGNGAAYPFGITNRTTLGVTAASATAITADELIDLEHSVDPAYRVAGCRWMFNDSTLKAIRKLKDGNGQYLWSMGISGGVPATIDTFPYTINQSMASIATGNKTIIFGQLTKYHIRDVAEVRLRRLDERYAENDLTGFVMFAANDGNLLDAGVAPVKHLIQA